jgi:hypothetical protein
MSRKQIVALVFSLVVVGCLVSCNKTTSDFELTDLFQITQLLTKDPVATSIYPQVWIDTTSHAQHVHKASTSAGSISPQDYWVEILAHERRVPSSADSCRPDDYNQSDPCKDIQIDGNGRAHVQNALIFDSLACRYHIISEADQSIITKDVVYTGTMRAMMAKLGGDGEAYHGWSLYAIGAESQRSAINSAQPVIDSVVIEWGDQRFVSIGKPGSQRYVPKAQLPRIGRGESVNITAYASTADAQNIPIDAYIHRSLNGIMTHDRMDNFGNGKFAYDGLEESSGGETGTFSQIVIEVFNPVALRDTNVKAFGNVIWAVSYRVGG